MAGKKFAIIGTDRYSATMSSAQAEPSTETVPATRIRRLTVSDALDEGVRIIHDAPRELIGASLAVLLVPMAAPAADPDSRAAVGDAMSAELDRSMARIEFAPDGTILFANPNFLKTMGYSLHEIQGKHHSMFVSPQEKDSDAYRNFWRKLRDGSK